MKIRSRKLKKYIFKCYGLNAVTVDYPARIPEYRKTHIWLAEGQRVWEWMPNHYARLEYKEYRQEKRMHTLRQWLGWKMFYPNYDNDNETK